MVKRIKDNNTTQKLKIEKHEPYEKPYWIQLLQKGK